MINFIKKLIIWFFSIDDSDITRVRGPRQALTSRDKGLDLDKEMDLRVAKERWWGEKKHEKRAIQGNEEEIFPGSGPKRSGTQNTPSEYQIVQIEEKLDRIQWQMRHLPISHIVEGCFKSVCDKFERIQKSLDELERRGRTTGATGVQHKCSETITLRKHVDKRCDTCAEKLPCNRKAPPALVMDLGCVRYHEVVSVIPPQKDEIKGIRCVGCPVWEYCKGVTHSEACLGFTLGGGVCNRLVGKGGEG